MLKPSVTDFQFQTKLMYKLRNNVYHTISDLTSGFNQIAIEEKSICKTAINTEQSISNVPELRSKKVPRTLQRYL